MLNSLPLFVGLRYVRARSHKFFVSFITWVSLLCVCLGVMALIVILSVMNGLEGELRNRLLALSAHARVFVPARRSATPDWSALAAGRARGRRMSRAPRRSSRSRRWPCASRRCCRCACAASIPRHEGEVARIDQGHRRRQARRSHAGLRPRHRRPWHRADVRAGRRRSDHGAGAHDRCERRARAAAARIPWWPAYSMRRCRTTTPSC